MYEITFNEKKSYTDWGLILTNVDIGEPQLKTNMVSIPARDGQHDLSKALYERPVFDVRPITYEFVWQDIPTGFQDKLSDIMGYLHGQTIKAIHGDSLYYYEGLAAVGGAALDGKKAQITVTLEAYPYALAKEITNTSIALSATAAAHVLSNGRMPVIPELILEGTEANITYKNTSITISEGTTKSASIILDEGDNEIEVSGSGTLTIRYRQGIL